MRKIPYLPIIHVVFYSSDNCSLTIWCSMHWVPDQRRRGREENRAEEYHIRAEGKRATPKLETAHVLRHLSTSDKGQNYRCILDFFA